MAQANGIVWFAIEEGEAVVDKHEGGDLIAVHDEFLSSDDYFIKHINSIIFQMAGCLFVYEGENELTPDSSIYRIVKPQP